MTDKLPPQLLALFQPRPNVRYIPPQDDSPEEKGTKQSQLGGVADFLPQLEVYKQEDEYHPTESWLQRKLRIKAEKLARQQQMENEDFDEFNPESDPKIKGDAIKTLFVGRLSYDVRESDLEREFSKYGPIERVRRQHQKNYSESGFTDTHHRYASSRMKPQLQSKIQTQKIRSRRKSHIEAMHSSSTSESVI